MNISMIFFALAALCFLLAAFDANIGDVGLVALGLALMAAGFAIERAGVPSRIGTGERIRD